MKKEMKGLKSQRPSHGTRQTETRRDNTTVNCRVYGCSGHLGRGGRGQGRGLQRGNQGPFKNQQGRQNGIKTKSDNSGIPMNAQICEKNVKLLVDTAAILTILNDNLYNSLKSSFGRENKLRRVEKVILSATNEPLNVSGKTEMSIKIGEKIYKQELAIAEMSMDGVIGLDFLNKKQT